jgi:hypothetical protein
MKITQLHYQSGAWNASNSNNGVDASKAQLVLVFGAGSVVSNEDVYSHIKKSFPAASIIGAGI